MLFDKHIFVLQPAPILRNMIHVAEAKNTIVFSHDIALVVNDEDLPKREPATQSRRRLASGGPPAAQGQYRRRGVVMA